MKKSIIVTLLLLTISISNVFAQEIDFDNLDNVILETTEDFNKLDKEILPYIEWVETHSLKHEKRMVMNRFLLRWVTGTAACTVTLNSYVGDYTKKNSDFLLLFLTGWSKHMLQNPSDKTDDLKGNLAGINSILDFYQKGKSFGVKKDKKIEKLLKLRKAGKLEDFIAKKI